MPSTRVFHVCIKCRSVDGRTNNEGQCKSCGEQVKSVPRNWRPPKKNNDRAWKRIANDEILWDRRATRRADLRYGKRWYRTYVFRQKKGQPTALMGGYKYERTTADLGG